MKNINVNFVVQQDESFLRENAKEDQAWHKHMGFIECGFISEINDDNTG